MTKQALRDNINLIKRKLTTMDNINEDIINEIINDVRALVNIKIEPETRKTNTYIKKTSSIKENKPDKPKTEDNSNNKINDIEFSVSEGVFILDLGIG